MSHVMATPRDRLILPFMSGFYDGFAKPIGWLVFRVIIGGLLVIEGWSKIMDPLAQTAFVESIGFHPGWFFSPLLAGIQVIGGGLMVIGLWTRPAALASTLMLLVTIWYHITHPYGDAFLTQEGIEFLKANTQYLTAQGQRQLLTDGGMAFLHLVQDKAVTNQIFWTVGAALIAAFGAGRLSVDGAMIGKEF
ncbi:DoxX family protein [Consotaella salsifontis]|uniref:Putative oxidoreductase n=1 Tax=Consotaella salsifontis TaxID=1365950 RepID=A0A1T4RSR1_9HYPH|nr:DoxX family protein [Consotaella salsifontis]SKA18937.1 putative oxidoreductase [Consotaella salsifontis]